VITVFFFCFFFGFQNFQILILPSFLASSSSLPSTVFSCFSNSHSRPHYLFRFTLWSLWFYDLWVPCLFLIDIRSPCFLSRQYSCADRLGVYDIIVMAIYLYPHGSVEEYTGNMGHRSYLARIRWQSWMNNMKELVVSSVAGIQRFLREHNFQEQTGNRGIS
jgi:hypothetical protein